MSNIAFLELKYGNIYGGYPNYYAISEIAYLVFEPRSNKIFLESFANNVDVDIVNVYSRTNELGNTTEKVREVVNLRTGARTPYDEEFQLGERELDDAFGRLRPSRMHIKRFLMNRCMKKYRIHTLIVFDGRRDVFLCEKAGIRFHPRLQIVDLQKDITKDTNYLFSMNKLAKVINFNASTHLRSNNCEYWLHPIAAQQIVPKSAAWDAARLLMVHQEYKENHDDFMMKAALLLNKIEMAKKVT